MGDLFDPSRNAVFRRYLYQIPPWNEPEDPVEQAFWRGWNFPDADFYVPKESDAYAAWLAGRETARFAAQFADD